MLNKKNIQKKTDKEKNFYYIFKKNKKIILTLILIIFILISGAIYWLFYFQNSSSNTAIVKFDDINNQEEQEEQEEEEDISPEIKQFGIKIDKIEVLAPVIQDVDDNDRSIYMEELKKGVAHCKGTALPKTDDNIFIFGHSSTVAGTEPYADVFARLGELEIEDSIIIYFKDEQIEYTIFEKKVFEENDSSFTLPTGKEQLTLMTCWPIGSNAKRLVIKSSPK